jgi:outer membrane protein insertion porin family
VILLYLLLSYTIADIKVESKTTDPNLIIQTVGFSTGDQFKESMIAQAVNNLSRLQLFNFVSVDTSLVGDGIFIKILVEEAPVLSGDVEFIGNKRIGDRDLKKRSELKSNQVLTDRTIFEARKRILDLYTEKTFYNTEVRDSAVPDTTGRIKLFFRIREGEPLRIGKIEFTGNLAFSDGKLKRKIENKEKGFLRSGKMDRAKLKSDVEKIKSFYKENGYLDVQCEEPSVEAKDNRLVITFPITEGRRYFVGDVTFEGNAVFATEQLSKNMKIKNGDIYNLTRIQQALQDFGGLYADEGYIYCSIVPMENARDSIIDINFLVNEQSPANINRVIITGNYRTREKVIRREIVTMPGQRLRRSQVIRSAREVMNLGLFEGIDPLTGSRDDSGNVDLIYGLKEKEGVGSVGAGVAYSAQDRLTGYLELSHPNMFGRGQKMYTKIELGGRLTNFQLGLTEPWLFDTRTSAGVDVYYTNRLWDYYTKRDIGSSLNVSFPFYIDYTRLNYNFRVERTQILDISKTYIPPTTGYNLYDDTIPHWTVSNSFGLIRDTRDFIFNPSSGSYISLQTEIAKKFLFANVDYNRMTFEARTYFPVWWKFILMARMRAGLVTSVDEVPLYKRFYAGGTGEDGIRGYPDRSLSPMENGRSVGGNALFINNLELKLKISQGMAILMFYDMGNSFPSWRDVNLNDLKRGLGAGFRIEIPMMGVVGFDLGYGFDREHPGFEPHFQINPFGMF